MSEPTVTPRLLRPKQAYAYLSMSRTAFEEHVRPYIKEQKIGTRGVAFDRYELDLWVESRDEFAEIEPVLSVRKNKPCPRKAVSLASLKGATSGISISKSQDMAAFAAALEQVTGRKPKNT